MESSAVLSPTPSGRLPLISRKIKACSACRNLKIKCRMSDSGPPCARCRAKNMTCVLDKNLQSLIEDNSSWKSTFSDRVTQLQNAVEVLLRNAELPGLTSFSNVSSVSHLGAQSVRRPSDITAANDDDLSMEPSSRSPQPPQLDNDIFSQPMSTLYEVTRLRAHKNSAEHPLQRSAESMIASDFISRGVISEKEANHLFCYFKELKDHFLYGIMCPHESLHAVRQASTLLTAVICTVSALDDPAYSSLYDVCQREFLYLVSSTMFSRSHSLDDVRAMIIGAFYLSNISWTMSGHAIRIATGLHYDLSYYKALDANSSEEFEKARLWYILYITDHHSSILYGRPPIIHSQEAIHKWENFIRSPLSTQADVRMSSQVSLYLITSRAFEMFGSDFTRPIPAPFLNQLRIFNAELDNWYTYWGERLQTNPALGNFPHDGVLLHYHSAKIHLCSYAFRGLNPDTSQDLGPDLRENAAFAVSSAMSVLDLVLTKPDLRNALVGVHIYFHAMIAFAAVFLLKVTTRFQGLLVAVDEPRAFELVENVARQLKCEKAAAQHLVYHIGNGLEKLLAICKDARRRTNDSRPRMDPTVMAGMGTAGGLVPMEGEVDTTELYSSLDAFDLFQFPLGSDPESWFLPNNYS